MKITEGERLPFGYGIAWRNWNEMTFEAYPIPFNWCAYFIRELYLFLARGPREAGKQKIYNAGREVGFKSGKREGYANGVFDGRKKLQDQIQNELEKMRILAL